MRDMLNEDGKVLLDSILLAAKMLDYVIDDNEEALRIFKREAYKFVIRRNSKGFVDFYVNDSKNRKYIMQESLRREEDMNRVLKMMLSLL